MDRIKVGVLGATGMVGQNYIRLLDNHPWFEVAYVAASPNSAGKRYEDAVAGRWHMRSPVPESARDLIVGDANQVSKARGKCGLVFSAVEMDKAAISALELEYASGGFAVVSNNSAHRHTPDVPMVIPEINPLHLDIIPEQRKKRGWDTGLLAVKCNCSIQSYMTPLYALLRAEYRVSRMILTTLQALSGAGYPGPSAIDLVDNIVPYIKGEEEKSEIEPQKVLGRVEDGVIVNDTSIRISAHCNRVAVTDGHTACVSLEFDGRKPELDEILGIWRGFRGVPQELDLPFAPARPIIYRDEPDRPQPQKDRDEDKAMAVTVGRLRRCNVFDIRFIGLHHNTVRGAAGGAILTAELLKARGYLNFAGKLS
ncbi:MAG TPA: aspartate-semialdehyde dehydrogenase [Spirochaetia bacterium]|nr:aspartate-semialdehyde dehydrogenase [Spirochaetia bacterium]